MKLKHTVERAGGWTFHEWRGPKGAYRLVISAYHAKDRAARRSIAAQIRHLRKVLPERLGFAPTK